MDGTLKSQSCHWGRYLRFGLLFLITLLTFNTGIEPALAGFDPPYFQYTSELNNPSRQRVGEFWLILDSAQPIETVVPRLVDRLIQLKAESVILDFDPQPVAIPSSSASALLVITKPSALMTLRRLPGVLEITAEPPFSLARTAMANTTGTVSGRITNIVTGLPIEDAGVNVYDSVSFAFLGTTSTDADGIYQTTITAPYGQVKLIASAFGYIRSWYDNQPTFAEATAISLEGGLATQRNVALIPGGTINGVLTFAGGEPAQDVTVSLFRAGSFGFEIDSTVSDAQGQFFVSGLPTDAYKLRFVGGEVVYSEWYQDQNSFYAATPINVTAGLTKTVSAQLSKGGTISGILTDATTQEPATSIDVSVIDQAGRVVKNTFSHMITGAYQVSGLPPGQYHLLFAARPVVSSVAYEKSYYNEQMTAGSATVINLNSGDVVDNINANLVRAGQGAISGTFTKNGGIPLNNEEEGFIKIYDPELSGMNSIGAILPGNGITTQYQADVKVGEYKVEFGLVNEFRKEYYNNQPSYFSAGLVVVEENITTPNINADLPLGEASGTITGTLKDGNGQPVSGRVSIQAYPLGADNATATVSSMNVSDNGVYELTGLTPGNYVVSFSQFPYATTWYSAQMSRADAVPVMVMTEQATTDINGVLDQLGACISGHILRPDGRGIGAAMFEVYDTNNQRFDFWAGNFGVEFVQSGQADTDGGYIACGLPAGTYIITATGGLVGMSEPVTVSFNQSKENVDVVSIYKLWLAPIFRGTWSSPNAPSAPE